MTNSKNTKNQETCFKNSPICKIQHISMKIEHQYYFVTPDQHKGPGYSNASKHIINML